MINLLPRPFWDMLLSKFLIPVCVSACSPFILHSYDPGIFPQDPHLCFPLSSGHLAQIPPDYSAVQFLTLTYILIQIVTITESKVSTYF